MLPCVTLYYHVLPCVTIFAICLRNILNTASEKSKCITIFKLYIASRYQYQITKQSMKCINIFILQPKCTIQTVVHLLHTYLHSQQCRQNGRMHWNALHTHCQFHFLIYWRVQSWNWYFCDMSQKLYSSNAVPHLLQKSLV